MATPAELSRYVRRAAARHIVPRLPNSWRKQILGEEFAWSPEDAQPIAHAQDAPVRCLIAPANFGSQGYYWAQAANSIDGVYCTNLQFLGDQQKVIGPAGYSVNHRVGKYSRPWARRQFRAIREEFTHVILEASTPLLGGLHGGDLRRELKMLEDGGVKVGFASHGSEVRVPSRHVQLEQHSPFLDDMGGRRQTLENRAVQNLKLLDELGRTEFVSTPDLIEFRPNATWLPLLTDPSKWTSLKPIQLGERIPVVLHVPSSRPALKGSVPIDTALSKLADEGLIDYLRVNGVPYEEMPEYVERADVVVNQVGIGAYGAFALESMLGGRVVVTQVWDSVREYIREQTGYTCPIVEANPSDVYEVVRRVVEGATRYAPVGKQSQEFAEAVHSFASVAERLRPFLLG